jgi:YbbR domain-containing protein
VVFYLDEIPGNSISKQAIARKIEELVSVQVTDVDPSFITIEIDSSASRMVPVRLVAQLDFEQDFAQTDSVVLTPDSVMVSGAPEILAQIPFVPTRQLALSKVQQPIQALLALDISEEGLFRVFPSEVEVFVPVEQFIQKSFEVPIEVLKDKNNFRIIPSSATLKCALPLDKYEQTTDADFMLEADFSASLNLPNQNAVPIRLIKAPDWAKHIFFEPKAVEYYIVQ